MAVPRFAFLVHPLVGWQRHFMGVRRGHLGLAVGGPAGVDAVGLTATLRFPTHRGPVDAYIIGVPDLPSALVRDQNRAFTLQTRAAQVAQSLHVSAIGLGSALAVVAGRGRLLAENSPLPITTGHASTTWATTEITHRVVGEVDHPIGVIGFKGTVAEAIAARLVRDGRTVWVEATGKAAERRAKALGCVAAPLKQLVQETRFLVGGSTTGPVLDPTWLRPKTTLIDLALPPTLQPGDWPRDLRIVAGETLQIPGALRTGFWGRVWLGLAQYGHNCIYACLAEPMAIALTGESGWSERRRLSLHDVDAVGDILMQLGYEPIVQERSIRVTKRLAQPRP